MAANTDANILDSEKKMSTMPNTQEVNQPVQKTNRKTTYLAIFALLNFTTQYGFAQRPEVEPVVSNNQVEETVVRAQDLSKFNTIDTGVLFVGINGKPLVHIYDKSTDTWKYVNTHKKQDG